MYEFRNLETTNFEEITDTWNLAFSDYIVPVNVTPEKLEAYFKVTGVDKSRSFGAYYGGKLVGLLINSVDIYRGSKAAYDAMTGVVPEHRGKGLFTSLFEHTRNNLKNDMITHYYLEVITTNEKAVSIYTKKGGKVEREFVFLNGKANEGFGTDEEPVKEPNVETTADVKDLPLSAFPEEDIALYEPSFGNRISALRRNLGDHRVAYTGSEKDKTAAIFNTQGIVLQIMYNGTCDRALLFSVLAYLSQKFEELRISNIPVTERGLIDDLLKIGFKILVRQYEMCIEL